MKVLRDVFAESEYHEALVLSTTGLKVRSLGSMTRSVVLMSVYTREIRHLRGQLEERDEVEAGVHLGTKAESDRG